MVNFQVRTYNAISPVGLNRFGSKYLVAPDIAAPDAIMLRSFDLHSEHIADSVLAVGRAGAGVNNIPVRQMSERGIVVFNAPGANANSVKELVVAAMLLAARNLPAALDYVRALPPENMKEAVERGKKQFAGHELGGQTLGVIGLGATGHRVANVAVDLGMRVLGYDPAITIQNATRLSPSVQLENDLKRVLADADFVTIHAPLVDGTRNLMNAERLALMQPGSVLLNFSRQELADSAAVLAALDAGQLGWYVTDFPEPLVYRHEKVIALPHLGASTNKAEDNCAMMIADQLQDYLENGNIKNSVNFPDISIARRGDLRLALAHKNEPGMIAHFTQIVGGAGLNIAEFINGSNGELAYTIMELNAAELPDDVLRALQDTPSLLRLRVLGTSPQV